MRLRLLPPWLRRRLPAPPACSFCGKSDRQAGRLLAGPRVFICDECVRLCVGILAES